MKKINKKGFTLTELIVVIAVIAILAAVLIPTLTGYIEKARVSADNQEVAVLNKLLLGAEIDEIEFENVPQLKKYLEEEMEYDGDYSLSVKGSYLCFDKEKYEFVIVKESDVEGLVTMSSGYKLATGNISSPEALFKNDNDAEVWIIGGKGELVEIVEEIRNIGNNGSDLTKFNSLSNNDVKALLTKLFDNYVFSGTAGTFEVSADGKVSSSTNTEKEVISSGGYKIPSLFELRLNFYNEIIASNLQEINSMMKGEGNVGTDNYIAKLLCSEPDQNGRYEVTVDIKQNGITSVISGVLKAIEYIKNANCSSANIYSSSLSIEDYTNILTEVKEAINYLAENENLEGFEYKILNKNALALILNQIEEIDSVEDLTIDALTKVDISLIDPTADLEAKDLVSMIKPIILALNLSKNEETKQIESDVASIETYDMSLIESKEKILVIAEISDSINGNYTIEYVFHFNVNIENKK